MGEICEKWHEIMIDDEELEALKIESSQTIEIDSFIPLAQIDEP